MKILLALLIVFILVCIVSWIVDTHRFVVKRYEIRSTKIKKRKRFVLISDLHNKEYGPGNEKLLAAIDANRPDAILIAGDVCNGLKDSDFTPAVNILQKLAQRYDLYYGFGNHEYRLRRYPKTYGEMWEKYSEKLAECNVHIMDNERVSLPDENIEIAAVNIDREFYKRFRKGLKLKAIDVEKYLGECDSQRFELLIAHNPEYFKAYKEWGADLTVSGHVHGGILRLPFIGGVVSPRLLGFPKYNGGEYTLDDKKMIVSCGLGTHTLHVRIFNPAELSVIDLIPQ